MRIDKIHDTVRRRVLKDQQGYLTPQEIDAELHYQHLTYFSSLFGTPHGQQPGRPVSVVSAEQNQRVRDDLTPFLETKVYNSGNYNPTTNALGTAPQGKVVLPEDFQHFSSLSFSPSGSYSEVLTTEFLASLPGADQVVNVSTEPDRLYRITLENPDGTVYSGTTKLIYNDLEGGADVTIHAGGTVNTTGIYYYTPSDYNGRFTVNPTTDLIVKFEVISNVNTWDDVEVLGDDQYSSRIASSLLTPSTSNPIATIDGVGGFSNGEQIPSGRRVIEVYPYGGYRLRLRYFRSPVEPVFAFTLTERSSGTGGARFVYDDANSTQMEWGDTALTLIIERTIRALSTSIQDPGAYQDSSRNDTLPR